MKVAKELVDSGDVNPMEIENELISNVDGTAMLWIMNGKGGYPYCSIVETEKLDD